MVFNNIPAELRAYRQFCLWRYEETDKGKPTKVPYALNADYAKVNDPSTWCSFEEATECYLANTNKLSGIGFVLTADDPFCFIDLDEPKNPDGSPLGEEEHNARMHKQRLIHSECDSYSEMSPSGKGLHIIVKGKVESGRRRESIEVYSDLRFMTMTGQVFNNAPIAERQSLINDLWAQMGRGPVAQVWYSGLDNIQHSDEDVITYAINASNGEKFKDLYYTGNWQKYYTSQSEADFALIDIIAFYSKHKEQTKRIFRNSPLAARDKRTTIRGVGYLDHMTNRSLDNILPPVDFEGLRNQVNEAIANSHKTQQIIAEVQQQSHQAIEIDEDKVYRDLPPPQEYPTDVNPIYIPPKGLLGEIAEYIYAQSAYPVPEIALAAAIGLMSAITGKAYNVSETGLNQYTLLLAATGTGKEFSTRGIHRLMAEVYKSVPAARCFIGPSKIASPQALQKALAIAPSMISIQSEFHAKLKEMASERASPHMEGLKSMYLELYNRSGEGDQTGALIYSDKEKNTDAISAVSFSIFGESAPEPFYEALNESMITNGLLTRFTVIDYKGDRVMPNDGAELVKPSEELVRQVATLCANSLMLINQKKVVRVGYNEEAKKLLNDFRMVAHRNIVGSMEVRRQLWNRAHLKVLKMSACIAVGMHNFHPIIDADAVRWSIRLIEADIKNMQGRFETGEVGSNNEETKQTQLVTRLIRKFLMGTWAELEKTVGGPKFKTLHENRIIPYSYLQRNTSTAPAFKTDRTGATNALKRAMKIFQDRGDLQQMARGELMTRFNVGAECYAVTSLAAFGL